MLQGGGSGHGTHASTKAVTAWSSTSTSTRSRIADGVLEEGGMARRHGSGVAVVDVGAVDARRHLIALRSRSCQPAMPSLDTTVPRVGTQQDSGSGRSRSRHGDGPYRSNAGDVPFAVDGGGSSGPVAVCVMWAASCGELPYHLLDPRRRRRRRPCAATREGRPMAPLLREHLKRRCRRRLRRWVWWAWA